MMDDTKQLKQPKNFVLKNGNLTGFYETDKDTHAKVSNTCGYDSVIQICAVGYMEYPNFKNKIVLKKDDVPSLQLVNMLCTQGTQGACKETYLQRVKANMQTCTTSRSKTSPSRHSRGKRTKVSRLSGIHPYACLQLPSNLNLQYDMYGNLSEMMDKLFAKFPSVQILWKCPNGHEENLHQVLISVNYEHLIQVGMNNFQDSIEFGMDPPSKKCTHVKCDLDMTEESTFEEHLFINLDSLMPEECAFYGKKYRLEEIPHQINLRGNTYALIGLVSHKAQHYSALARRKTNHWEKIDDMNKSIYHVSSSDNVTPHLLFYVALRK